MSSLRIWCTTIGALALTLSGIAHGSTLVSQATWSEANGHHYVAFAYGYDSLLTWDEAAAEIETVLPGYHLATITSKDEMNFVWSMVEQAPDAGWQWWIGGYQDPGEEIDPAAGWKWVTGEPWGYEVWLAGEPNDARGIEDHLTLFGGPRFNDEGTAIDNVRGFIAESSAVPLPAMGWLLLPAFALLGRSAQKRADRH